MSFMLVTVIPEHVTYEITFLIFLSSVSSRRLLSISLGSLFFNSFPYGFAIEHIILNRENNKSRLFVSNPLGIINPPDCIILGNWVFENFILAD